MNYYQELIKEQDKVYAEIQRLTETYKDLDKQIATLEQQQGVTIDEGRKT